MPEKYPLAWPVGYPRTQSPSRSAFKNPTFGKAVLNIIHEINRLNGKVSNSSFAQLDTVISSNIPLRNDGLPRADYIRSVVVDKGVAVYFKSKGSDVVLCCDKWDTVESNMHSIYLTIEALRSIERWGVSDFLSRSFTGFKALAPRNWWIVLEFKDSPFSFNDVHERYKSLAKSRHPDAGGSQQDFQELNDAYEKARRHYGA